jgi:hypothetical protein
MKDGRVIGQAFQRASSAVEGRNGSLAQLHHNQRGLPKQRYKVWAVLHNSVFEVSHWFDQ